MKSKLENKSIFSMIKFIFNVKTDHFEGSTASGRRQSKLFVLDPDIVKEKEFFSRD